MRLNKKKTDQNEYPVWSLDIQAARTAIYAEALFV